MKKIDSLCLVDDDYMYQFLTQKAIKKTGKVKEMRSFSNGREAMQYIHSAIKMNERLPDVILLDLNMPIMDGWQFLEEYNALKPQLDKKIILYVITSSIDPADLEKAKKYSEITDFIIKPVSKSKLEEVIEALPIS